MITLFNAFIVLLACGAAVLGVSALVQKRTARRQGRDRTPGEPAA